MSCASSNNHSRCERQLVTRKPLSYKASRREWWNTNTGESDGDEKVVIQSLDKSMIDIWDYCGTLIIDSIVLRSYVCM